MNRKIQNFTRVVAAAWRCGSERRFNDVHDCKVTEVDGSTPTQASL